MSNTEITDWQLNQEKKKPRSSCYDLVEHPERIKPLGDSLLSLDLEQIDEYLTKIIRGLNKKTETVVIEDLKNCSKKISDTIETANFFMEQLIFHKIEFKGYLFFLERQMSVNITKGLRVVRNLREKGFSSLTPIAKSLVVDLDQVRQIVLTKDLAQLKESLENYRTAIARNRHKTIP